MVIDQLTVLPADAAELAPWSLTGAEVREVLTAASRARTSLDALMARLAGAADSMGLPREDGATSTTAWVANTTGIHRGEASKLSRLGRRLGPESRFAATGQAWGAGELSTDQAGVILDALDKLPEHIDHEPLTLAEKVLIEQAAELNLDDLKRAANRVLEHVDPDGADEALGQQVRAEEQRAFDQTRLTMKNKNNGMTDGTFRLPTADVDVLRAAIEGIIAPRRNGENARRWELGLDDWKNLSHDRKAGHAFIELLAHLPTDALPLHGGLAATVAVTVDVDDLRTGQGTATTSSGTTTSAARAQRMACNAHLVALYLDSESRVIDHGMARRLYDRHQRLILAVRDQGFHERSPYRRD